MSQENQITLRGYVTAEPKCWETAATRTPVAELRIGSTSRRLNRDTGEWQDGDTSYYTVKCWRRLAINVASSLRKGDMVFVRGKFVTRQWVDDQQRARVQVLVEADTVGHDLLFGWSHFMRGLQAPPHRARRDTDGGTGQEPGQQQAADPDAGYSDDAYSSDGYLGGGDDHGAEGNRGDDGRAGGADDAGDPLGQDSGAATDGAEDGGEDGGAAAGIGPDSDEPDQDESPRYAAADDPGQVVASADELLASLGARPEAEPVF